MKRFLIFLLPFLFFACSDDDSPRNDSSLYLSFSQDTLRMDTVFSRVPSSTKSFMVYNNNGYGLRISNVRLSRGNQTGFRVNVDGTYLSETIGYQVSGLELRGGDSLRVFVEITAPENFQYTPQQVSDDLVFTLESGVQQRVNLNAWAWDALMLSNMRIQKDSTFSSTKPVVIYGGIVIDSAATFTIAPPTTLYFHADAGVDVYGTLKITGTTEQNVTLRGDRLDRMFDYLPYDRVPGQWQGIRIHSSSYGNYIANADIHSGQYGIIADSTTLDTTQIRVSLLNTIIHNCQGPGFLAFNSIVVLTNCQLTNTLGDCFAVYGGRAQLMYCTLAQFYPFDSDRGAALRFSNYLDDTDYPLDYIIMGNSIVTGYADDVVMGESKDSVAYDYLFVNSILRTPEVEGDSSRFQNVIWETAEDSIEGSDNFISVNSSLQYYDFHLDTLSRAVDAANADLYWHESDRDGYPRDEKPDMGCYEARKAE